ncbi:MAG: histidine phosphatase family protein, partial [Eggerthellaceae bacterium]|nr:histidine phosphatase family protein [Eggerthellaceae bacterium]
MESDSAYRTWVEGNCEGTCPGGESRAVYLARSNSALELVLHKACEREEGRVIVVAHGGTIMAAFSAFAAQGEQRDYFSWQVPNAQGYRAMVDLCGALPLFSNCTPFETLPA